ncbi:uncharacterized protein LOC6586415 [Drosophila mojavensis]|uniref:C2H2-type domain-containing protein n=1 Tax=Drosophila mojavensis TaxID=7230 RepID=B4L8Y4_DROMO|nr:uncharacterized protein LOC6586415 [Drosophila mojavensis]EDW17159.1 uncharacterized protein Dmoj_GI16739 [Drosophila mojavensis]
MNADADVAFTSFYSTVGSQLQHADLSLSTPIHSLEPDNFSGFFDDESALLSIPLPIATGAAAASSHKSSSAGIVDSPCIPFVQIHTTDLQQQPQPSRSYRNGFRRKTAEIKSEAELIKSELAEAAAKERTNATPTPPTAKAIASESCQSDLPLNKCPSCPFLSLCPLKTQTHISSCFGIDAQHRLLCPGCANVFYSIEVLNLHLSADHQLEPQEIAALAKANDSSAKKPPQPMSQPKSRIYIKNVNCLREPQLPDFLPPDDNILDLLDDVEEASNCSNPQHQQQQQQPQQSQVLQEQPSSAVQKISIKSVDVLREPALLPFDFPMPSNEAQQQQQQQEVEQLPPLMINNNLLEKPRQPKIYIRNVDILKEPMLLPGMGFGNATASTVASPAEVFNAETLLTPTGGPLPGFEPLTSMCPDAFSFDSVLSGASGAGHSASSGSSHNFSALDLDFSVDFEQSVQLATESDHSLTSEQQQQQQQLTELAPQEELNRELDNYLPPAVPAATATATAAGTATATATATATVAATTTATTTTATTSKQKIFIKNVDILKAPQRGTLHLRTVDELNLMNRNEVEHLIVPNREPLPLELPLNAPAVALEPSLVDLPPPPAPLSYDDGYDLAEDLECWPWMDDEVEEADPQPAQLQLEPPHNDPLVKDFPQLYAPPAATSGPVPPLVPVTGSIDGAASAADSLSGLPVPPLVPLPSEKPARIYVANNLLPTTAAGTAAVEQPPVGGTSVRGRPYGAKQGAGQSKRRLGQGAAAQQQEPSGKKCTVEGCMFRFKSPATLEYHGRCHNGALGSAQPMICPECKSTQFSNWNCLHTHLWRTHAIDMELYCCQLCNFKTPIYSRLVNTHAKIHSEERNYKCEQCGKGFKNTKQLKNHRRLHRTQGLGMGKPASEEQQQKQSQLQPILPVLHRCEDCGAAFKHRKTLREHLCKQRNEQPQCPTCQRVFSSKSSLKLHMRSHQADKRFKCDKCDYEANDHNAFRRHMATHREQKRYACPHCDFRAIQSTAYRIHLQKVHPELELSAIIHKCNACKFSSINHGLLLVHQAKHHPVEPSTAQSNSKIKVKSSL